MKGRPGVGRHRAYFTKGTALPLVIPESWAHWDLISSGGGGAVCVESIDSSRRYSFLYYLFIQQKFFELSLSTRLW